MSISVLLSVYHKEKAVYLSECLESLASQTIRNFEIVLVEDGPLTKELEDVIVEFRSKVPLKSVVLKENVGLARALNIGLEHCCFDLVARMDTDDIALPFRLEVQQRFMNENPSIAVCSSWIEERDETMSRVLFRKELPPDQASILSFAKFRNPINHPAAMFRRHSVLSVKGYPDIFPEDYALWSVMLQNHFQFGNIPEVLLYMRTGENFIERRGIHFLKGEFELLRFQKRIGFLTRSEYVRNVIIRSALRLPPKLIRKFIYQWGR